MPTGTLTNPALAQQQFDAIDTLSGVLGALTAPPRAWV